MSEGIPAFERQLKLTRIDLRVRIAEAADAWLARSPSPQTRDCYARDLRMFLEWSNIPADQLDALVAIRPAHVPAWQVISGNVVSATPLY